MDVDGQQIDRMTGKAAPPGRVPRGKGAGKKKAAELKSRKGKDRAEDNGPPSDQGGGDDMDTEQVIPFNEDTS